MSLNLMEDKVGAASGRGATLSEEIKKILEALLFSSSEPLPFQKIKEIVNSTYPIRSQELMKILQDLKKEFHTQKRGVQIDEIAHGFLLRTVEEVHPFVEMLHQDKRGEKLSKAAMEVLAIISYKQPITRAEVEKIRGVDSSGTISSLLERELIEIVGKLEAPGRPSQYGITLRFLKHFGLKSAEDLGGFFKKQAT